MANFCKHCGRAINPTSRFCKNCGREIPKKIVSEGTPENAAKMQAQPVKCRYCGNPVPAQARFCKYCGAPAASFEGTGAPAAQRPVGFGTPNLQRPGASGTPTAQHPAAPGAPAARAGRTHFPWKRTIAAVLILVIGIHLISNHLTGDGKKPAQTVAETSRGGGGETETRPGSGGGSGDGSGGGGPEDSRERSETFDYEEWYDTADYRLEKTWKTEQLADGIFTEENRSISAGDVRMTVEEGYLPEDIRAEIRRAPETVSYTANDVTVPLTMYEFNAEGVSDETFMKLEIPVEKPAGGDVGCGWYDEETGMLWPVSFDYDEARRVAVIEASHLSTYCGFPIKDEYTKNAMIAYLSNEELDEVFEKMDGDRGVRNAVYAMVHTMEGDSDDWELGMQVANDLGTANMIVGSVVSAADAIGSLEKSMTFADGVGNTYVKNSIGTVGEIMNTNWGKAGSMPKWFRNYHGKAVDVPLTDKLRSVYPYDDISRIGNNINKMNIALSCFKILNHAIKGDTANATWEAAQLGIDRTLNVLASESYGISLPGLSVSMIGVGLIAYALSEFYSEAISGRQQVYIKAYQKYYTPKVEDSGYRSGDQWVLKLEEIIKGCKSMEEASEKVIKEVDDYAWEFWTKYGSAAYLAKVMTEEEKIAWGAAGEAGLKEEDKKKISNSFKAELIPTVEAALTQVSRRSREAQREEYKKTYEKLRRQMNRRITVHISDGTKPGEASKYAGCTVRFAGIYENQNVKDKKQFEAVLDSNGKADISFTFLAHVLNNAGDVMQIVAKKQKEGGELKVLGEHHFSMETPDPVNPFCVFSQDELEEEKEQEEAQEEHKPGSGVYEMYLDYEYNLQSGDGKKTGPARPRNNTVEVFDDDTFSVEIPAITYSWTDDAGKEYTFNREQSIVLEGVVTERQVSEGLTVVAGYITESVPDYYTDRMHKGYIKGGWEYPDGILDERFVFTTGGQGVINGHSKDEGDHGYSFYLMIYHGGRIYLNTTINLDYLRKETYRDGELNENNTATYDVQGVTSVSFTFQIDKPEEE